MKRIFICNMILITSIVLTGCKVKVEKSYELSDGLALAEGSNGKYGYVESEHSSGDIDWIIEPIYYEAHSFSDGIAWVKYDEDDSNEDEEQEFKECWTIINTNGDELDILGQEVYNQGSSFKNGISRVDLKALDPEYGCKICAKEYCSGLINTNGDVIVSHDIWGTESDSNTSENGFISVKDFYSEKYGYINKSGEWIIHPQFDFAGQFKEGFANVKIDGKWGYINEQGTVIVDYYFDTSYPFKDGIARAYIDLDEYEVHTNGDIIPIKKQSTSSDGLIEDIEWLRKMTPNEWLID